MLELQCQHPPHPNIPLPPSHRDTQRTTVKTKHNKNRNTLGHNFTLFSTISHFTTHRDRQGWINNLSLSKKVQTCDHENRPLRPALVLVDIYEVSTTHNGQIPRGNLFNGMSFLNIPLFIYSTKRTRPLPRFFRCLNDFSMPDCDVSSCALAPPGVARRLALKLDSPFLEVVPPLTTGAQLESSEDRLVSLGAIKDADI